MKRWTHGNLHQKSISINYSEFPRIRSYGVATILITIFLPGRIIWDKCNGNSSFSDCEIAACSFHDSVRLFRYMWNGMQQGKSINEGWIQQGNKSMNEKRIHQTQKPVNLVSLDMPTIHKGGGDSPGHPCGECKLPYRLRGKWFILCWI